MESRLRLLFKDMRIVSYVVLVTVLLAAFQNCGELKSNSDLSTTTGYGNTSLEDSDLSFSKAEFVLNETDSAPTDMVTISLKSGSSSARFTYQLVELPSGGGQPTPNTIIGTLEGSATINEAFTSQDIRLIVGSNSILNQAKSRVLFVVITKEEPTQNTFVIPIRVNLATGTPGGGVNPNPDPNPNPTTPPKVVTPDNATIAERQDRCVNYATARPSFGNSFNDTVLNLGFGLSNANAAGVATEGNQISARLAISANKNITDQSNFALWQCDQNQVITFQIMTQVVTGEANNNAKPAPTFTYALSLDGSARDVSTAALRNQLAADSYAINGGNNNANQIALPVGGSVDFTINPRYTTGDRTQKCVGGSVWLRVTAVASFPNRNQAQFAQKVSDPQYVRLNLQNNCWTEHRLREAGNANYATQIALGTDVAVSGDWAAALAETDSISVAKQNVGAIYMFKKENGAWVRKGAKLVVNELNSNEQIRAIEMKGDVLIAGVPKRGRGVVYVFRRSGDTWNLAHTIQSAFPTGLPEFGRGLALSASHIAIGAPYANRVYMYPYTATTVGAAIEINGEDRVEYHIAQSHFGASLLFNGPHLIVGSPLEPGIAIPDDALHRSGAVHIYNVASGTPTFFKTFVGPQEMDRFGSNFAANGNKLAIASEVYKNAGGVSVGRVDYFVDYTAATTTPTRSWDGGVSNSYIGNGLAMTSSGIYIGTPNSALISPPGLVEYHPFTNAAGSAFGNMLRIRAYNEESSAKFGWSIAVDGNNIMIGAKNKRDGVLDGGAAFIYESR